MSTTVEAAKVFCRELRIRPVPISECIPVIQKLSDELTAMTAERDHYRSKVEELVNMPRGYLADIHEQNSVYAERDALRKLLEERPQNMALPTSRHPFDAAYASWHARVAEALKEGDDG